MSSLTLLMLLLCTLSMHACINARALKNFIEKETAHPDQESKAYYSLKEEFSKSATAGDTYKVIIHNAPNDLQPSAKTEGLKRRSSSSSQARSMLESSSPNHDNDEAIGSKENDVVEDIVVMDYAQPHRKPPIHNEKH